MTIVKFKITLQLNYEEILCVSHNGINWSTNQPIYLHWTSGNAWKNSIEVKDVHSFEYKYFIRKPDGEIVWESIPNRRFDTKYQTERSISVVDSWNSHHDDIKIRATG